MIVSTESLNINLGSSQWFDILDTFIYNAVDEIITKSPTYFLQWVSDMLCEVYMAPHKRLFSVDLSTPDLGVELCRVLVCKPSQRLRHLKVASLDRIYLLTMVSRYINLCKTAAMTTDDLILRQSKYAALSVIGLPHWKVDPVRMTVELYDRLALRFLEYIAEKYYRLASTRTQAMAAGVKMLISKQDLYANNMLTIIRAIHKFSSKKGTLTTFVTQWMQANNNPRFGHQYGSAYSLPQGKVASLSKQNWEDSGAMINIAIGIEEAENAASDIRGVAVENKENSSNLEMLYRAATMLRDDSDVAFYMKANSFPQISLRFIDHKAELQGLERCVKNSIDVVAEKGSGGASVW